METWGELANRLAELLGLSHRPTAITYTDDPPANAARFDKPMSVPTPDGRSGRVPASCVFWVEAADSTFSTVPADHGNCSVGRYVHGFASMTDIQDKEDVATLLGSGWVSGDEVAHIPYVTEPASSLVYGPLDQTEIAPDVVLLRVNPAQMMRLTDAMPELTLAGKPQCHIVAVAKEAGRVAASVGCALSRVRTGMGDDEMTCAIPGGKLAEVVSRLSDAVDVDDAVGRYASADAQRFTAAAVVDTG